MSKSKSPVPVNIITGALGVGKTTALNHLLAQRPEHERWAILVNEYGQIGLDAALLQSNQEASDVDVREVAGGCICCSAGVMFEISLVLLLQRRPDRLLIEPTGLATLSGILDTLARPGIREAVDVRSILCLIDPKTLDGSTFPVEVQDQIEAADILLANRSDLANASELQRFDTWAEGLFPRKRSIERIEYGRISLAMLDLVQQRASETLAPTREAQHRHEVHGHATEADHPAAQNSVASREEPLVRREHNTALARTMGWSVWAERVFDTDRLDRWMFETAARPGMRRLKAVLRTGSGWRAFNIADGATSMNPSAYRRDSRLEIVWMGDARGEPVDIENGLLSCLVERETAELAT
ncbi:MAG: GTP-binding protein [Myxococcota bacterium]